MSNTVRKGWTVAIRCGELFGVIAVFRTKKRAERWAEKTLPAAVSDPWKIAETTWWAGVGAVRLLVLDRDNYTCQRCGKYVTDYSGQMDEKQDRGKGGEVSIFNCRTLCWGCHIGPRGKHGKARSPRFTRTRL